MTTGTEHFDAIVVGSGFGGSVTAFRLAEAGLRVCVLERGKAYPPGSFPRSPHGMAANFWDPSEGLHGLYNVWSFSGIDAVVSSGLGGGSLIYANVMIRKPEKWFVKEERREGGYEYWPVTRADLDPHYDRVERMMDVQRYPLDHEPYSRTHKTQEFRGAAERLGLRWELPPLAITFANHGRSPVPGEQIVEEENIHHLPRSTCRLVGECVIGCNFGSKNSMDFTYLSAAARLGAEIHTRSEVRWFEPIDSGYGVSYVQHGEEAEGQKTDTSRLPLVRLTATRLILSAGTFGTPYLLLRNHRAFPGLSSALGSRFSGNGDFLGLVLRARKPGDSAGKLRILDPSFGPVIASTVAVPDQLDGGSGSGRGFYIQDAGYPEFLNWLISDNLASESFRFGRFLARRTWARLRRSPNGNIGPDLRKALANGALSATSMPLLGMGRDVAGGRMSLRGEFLALDWNAKPSRHYYESVNRQMKALAEAMGATYASEPLWWVNLLVTVHPLGGAPMGRDGAEGVVDSYGQVFGYPGLSIADGSIMPGPVGPNPSLTIAAVADRSADWIIDHAGAVE